MAETDASAATTPDIAYEYVWFGGQPLAQIATERGEVAWYFNDHLGTPVMQTNAAADVVWRAEYEPFGNVQELRIESEHQPLRFPGQEVEQDDETAYNIFRWYRSGWGRYTQSDPIGLRGGINIYGYALDNPGHLL